MKKTFAVDLTLEIEPDYIEQFFEQMSDFAFDLDGTLVQYRYYVPKNEQESECN